MCFGGSSFRGGWRGLLRIPSEWYRVGRSLAATLEGRDWNL